MRVSGSNPFKRGMKVGFGAASGLTSLGALPPKADIRSATKRDGSQRSLYGPNAIEGGRSAPLFAPGLLAECNPLLEIMGFCNAEFNQLPDDPVHPCAMLVGRRQDRTIFLRRDIEPMHDTSTKTQF